MSEQFRAWKIDEAQLLPPSVQDYVPPDHLSRFVVTLVRESLDPGQSAAVAASISASRRMIRVRYRRFFCTPVPAAFTRRGGSPRRCARGSEGADGEAATGSETKPSSQRSDKPNSQEDSSSSRNEASPE